MDDRAADAFPLLALGAMRPSEEHGYRFACAGCDAVVHPRRVTLAGAPHGFGKKDVAALMPEPTAFLQKIGLMP